MLAKVLARDGTAFVVSLLELVEAIHCFEKSSSNAELQEMLRGLKKTDLTQLCKKYQLKSSGNKPRLIGRLLKKWKNNSSASIDKELMGALTLLVRTRAMYEQGTNWSKTLKGLSDFTFMDLYTYLVSCNKTFNRENLKAFRSLKTCKYFADDLDRYVHAGHISANDLVAIKAHCLSSLRARTTHFTFLGMKRNGMVVAAQCSYVACSNVYTCTDVLFRRQNEAERMHLPDDTSSTGRLEFL